MTKFPMHLHAGDTLSLRNFPDPRRVMIVGEGTIFKNQAELDDFVQHAIPVDTSIHYFAPVKKEPTI